MSQALHIFRKDVRQFRYLIALILVWTAAFVVFNALMWSDPDAVTATYAAVASGLSAYGLPAVWWLAVVLVIHAEMLPGDRQFWLTRPYSRASLVVAKALFVVVVILLPVFLAQAAILHFAHVPVLTNLLGLLWEQVLIVAILVWPVAAVASVTRTLVQCVFLAVPLVFAALIVESEGMYLGVFWLRATLAVTTLVLSGAVVLGWQYRRRATTAARLMGAVALIGSLAIAVFTPWRTVFGIQSILGQKMPSVAVTLAAPPPLARAGSPRGIHLSLRVSGLSNDTPFVCRASEIRISDASGTLWRSEYHGDQPLIIAMDQLCPVNVSMPAKILNAVADVPVRIEAVVYITAFGSSQEAVVPIDGAWSSISTLGTCQGAKGEVNVLLECRQAFRELGVLAFPRNSYSPYGRAFSYSPFPAELRIEPIIRGSFPFHSDTTSAVLTTNAPIAHLRLEVDVPNVHLPDYEFGG